MSAPWLVLAALAASVLVAGCAGALRHFFTAAELANPANEGLVRSRDATFRTAGGRRVEGVWGEILVPENRRVSDSRLIALTFRRVGAEGLPAIMQFTGGPGISNLKQRYPDELLRAYAVVEVGYRGIDSTPRLECGPLRRALVARDLEGDRAREERARAFADCLAQWRRDGIDPRGYQIADVVDDAEALRHALGLGKVRLLAQSYGTRVAETYLTRHPETIDSAVLIGANPPGHFFWSAADVHLGFAAYEPYFATAYPRYAGRLTLEALCARVLRELPPRALGLRLDPARIRAVTFPLLFHRETAAYTFDAFVRAYEDHNYVGLALLSASYGLVMPRMFAWGDFFLKGLAADFDPARAYGAEAAVDDPDRFGSPLGDLFFAAPYASEALAFRDPPLHLDIRTPTLILAGELDFSTPTATARAELAERFPAHVTLLEAPTLGHVGDFFQEPIALARVLVDFYGSHTVPAESPFARHPIVFRKKVGLTLF
ncbi:MAG: alpha/beta hydrolase [Myxococcales bacterium]